jgi:hypothetical protein
MELLPAWQRALVKMIGGSRTLKISSSGAGGNLEGTEEPSIYLTIYQTLVTVVTRAPVRFGRCAFSFEQTGWQIQTSKNVYQNVPWRRQIDELWQQDQEKKQQV